MELEQKLNAINSEELVNRFRSKEDLYRYMTHMSKNPFHSHPLTIVGLFLPSYHGTKIAFLRAILKNEKKVLRMHEVRQVVVPKYQELSVRNLYEEAMKDPEISSYLPSLEQSSNKLPERDFFFGIMNSLNPQYMELIIEEAERNRFQHGISKSRNDHIMITDEWLQELNKFPFLSRKPGKAIFLMKERSKIVRVKRNSEGFSLSQSLSDHRHFGNQSQSQVEFVTKRRKIGDSLAEIIQIPRKGLKDEKNSQ